MQLISAQGQAIDLGERCWLRDDALKVVPAGELEPASEHVLEVGQDAESTYEQPLQITDTARAKFTTAAS